METYATVNYVLFIYSRMWHWHILSIYIYQYYSSI